MDLNPFNAWTITKTLTCRHRNAARSPTPESCLVSAQATAAKLAVISNDPSFPSAECPKFTAKFDEPMQEHEAFNLLGVPKLARLSSEESSTPHSS
jgi:hypothetical protein